MRRFSRCADGKSNTVVVRYTADKLFDSCYEYVRCEQRMGRSVERNLFAPGVFHCSTVGDVVGATDQLPRDYREQHNIEATDISEIIRLEILAK